MEDNQLKRNSNNLETSQNRTLPESQNSLNRSSQKITLLESQSSLKEFTENFFKNLGCEI